MKNEEFFESASAEPNLFELCRAQEKSTRSVNAARGVGFIAYGKKSEKIFKKILSAIALEIEKFVFK